MDRYERILALHRHLKMARYPISLAKLMDGDILRLDAHTGVLEVVDFVTESLTLIAGI